MKSAIYQGWIRHRRYLPKANQFKYKVFMMYLDLAELDEVFSLSRLWSAHRTALARFKRKDFLGDSKVPLDQAVREHVESQTGIYPRGAVRILANLRYFGFIINPICCYYCFDEQDSLQFIVAEVNNTPWDDRHAYVLTCNPENKYQRIAFQKDFHVSPFNPMDINYDWRSNLPAESLRINMQNWRSGNKEFDATVALERKELTSRSLTNIILQYPFMTLKVVSGIYWEALKLFIKGIPIYDHPKNNKLKADSL
jgi:DUF1365 family protein